MSLTTDPIACDSEAVSHQHSASDRQDLTAARRESDRLFELLRPEVLYDRPIDQRHRIIFYAGHLDAFDFIQICREGLRTGSMHHELDRLFQAGIDPDSQHLPTDKPEDWPALEQVHEYVSRTRREVDLALASAPAAAVAMAIEHRLMHLETLAYMWHNLPYAAKVPTGLGDHSSATFLANEWCEVPAGPAVLGKGDDGSFGWDNEYAEHQVEVRAFEIQRYKVTNGEYLRFIEETGAPLPAFWLRNGGDILYRGMFEAIPLPLDWPVYVTQQQASAYAEWAGGRLPGEPEFHRAAYGELDGGQRRYPWGNNPPSPDLGNFDFRRWDPEPVTATPHNESAFGVRQMTGNGWEWTGTQFHPFAGFHPSTSYPGYSANFFDGEHYVLKGGSPRTAARLLRRSFRNWFRADYPYVYATFRCVRK